MYKKVLKISLVILLFSFPVKAMCWGQLGHRIVAEIADSYLTAKTKTEIKKILGNESIAMASNWGDFIKSDSTYKYLDTWHYINFEKNLTYNQLKEVLKKDTGKVDDAYSAIVFLTKELKKKSLSLEKKRMYLKLLIHFVGDIHQPLHVSPVGSTGGNDIKVQWFGQSSNLHRVWDSELIEGQQLSYTEYAAYLNHTTAAQRKKWQAEPISKWLYDSYVLAQDLHNEITETNPKLGYRYNYDHIKTLEQQMLKGGVHLAGLLNEIFGK
ncbi:MAG TPA: S1/P1 nuclease [Flavisolibacter sp.]|nr:S1/P1 nuclease [Flavisolibacter sp.]